MNPAETIQGEGRAAEAAETVLEVRNLSTRFFGEGGEARAVEDVSFVLKRGRTLGLVGESGCGKSVTALSIMRLVPDPPGRIVRGEVMLEGRDLLKVAEREMRAVRGNRIGMVFQEPMTSLNPVFTVGNQIMEAYRVHRNASKAEARTRALEVMRTVRIPHPEERLGSYPHELSGGLQQRVMIAMALICDPTVLIADEPTTALDVTIQSQILTLLSDLQERLRMAVLFITHDLAVVAETAHDVAVMYGGRIVETTDVRTLFAKPLHPYTRLLFRSIPRADHKHGRLATIQGSVPSPLDYPENCKFSNRCPLYGKGCAAEEPGLRELEAGHFVSCHRAHEVEELMQ